MSKYTISLIVKPADALVGQISQKSSVDDYSLFESHITAAVGSEEEKSEEPAPGKVRGGPLRELERFLLEKDPDNKFCGLMRMATSDGTASWTTKENIDRIQKEGEEDEGEEVRVGGTSSRPPNKAESGGKKGDDKTRPASPRKQKALEEAKRLDGIYSSAGTDVGTAGDEGQSPVPAEQLMEIKKEMEVMSTKMEGLFEVLMKELLLLKAEKQ